MSRPRVLIVEDEPEILENVEFLLDAHGFSVQWAADGDTGLARFREEPPDLVVLDLRLPGISGFDLFGEMRKERPDVPVIMATSLTDEADRVTGLELGADDYVTKPYSPRELVARVKAVLRRSRAGAAPGDHALSLGPLRVDPETYRVVFFGCDVRLSRQEFGVLAAFVRHPARVYTRATLIDLVYDGEHIVTDRSVDAQVKRIRRKLQEVRGDIDPIQTVYGLGYKLNQALEDCR